MVKAITKAISGRFFIKIIAYIMQFGSAELSILSLSSLIASERNASDIIIVLDKSILNRS